MREIDERVWRMVTRDGFAREFWAELSRRRAVRQTTSRREVFDYLNGLFMSEFGEPRFPSYDTFRHSREFRR